MTDHDLPPAGALAAAIAVSDATGDPIRDDVVAGLDLDLRRGGAVQLQVLMQHVAAGDGVGGWKVGMTSDCQVLWLPMFPSQSSEPLVTVPETAGIFSMPLAPSRQAAGSPAHVAFDSAPAVTTAVTSTSPSDSDTTAT